jgi:hypothetical protein
MMIMDTSMSMRIILLQLMRSMMSSDMSVCIRF